MSFSGNVGPFGFTIGGSRKRRSSNSTRIGTTPHNPSDGRYDIEDHHYAAARLADEIARDVLSRVAAELGPDPFGENATLDIKILVGFTWAVWLMFWGWAMDTPAIWSTWTWISLAGLTFTQVMTSPAARYVSITRRWHGKKPRESIVRLLLGTWATARTIPALTALPFLVTIVLSHLLSLSSYWDAPRGTLIAVSMYVALMPPLTSRHVRQVDEHPIVAEDAILQNFRNTFLLGYADSSLANLAKLKNQLEWTVKCLREMETTATSRNWPFEGHIYGSFHLRAERLRAEISSIE
jgi:hypothetical protein